MYDFLKMYNFVGYGIEGVCIFCLGYIHDIDAAMVMLCVGVGASGLAVSGK